MAPQTEHGFLVLADISGYTSYLAQVELDHAHEILSGLLEVIIQQFKSMLTISKLEGDAVFAYVNETGVPRPEALLELVEATYLAFRQRRDASQRQTTCTCRACKNIPSLELKFFIHQGDYIVQDINNSRELIGSAVNLIHRLMKNHVSEATGWKAYLLFTRRALESMHLSLDGLHEQTETYEHLGDVQTLSLDLQKRYECLVEVRRVVITPRESDLTLSCELDAPVSLVWQLITDPAMLTRTMHEGGYWSIVTRPGGRSGVGAQNHCAHGKGPGMQFTYLDWRPFQYYTAEAHEGKLAHWEMHQVEPLADGLHTKLTVRVKALMPLPHPIRQLMMSSTAKKLFLEFFERCRILLEEMDRTERA